MKKAELSSGLIKITFPYDKMTIAQVKTLPDRRWHPEGKYWTCAVEKKAIQSLKDWGFEGLSEETPTIPLPTYPTIEVPGLKGQLFPFQAQGVGFLEAKKGRALIADEMGLGKTIQALAWLQLHPELRPAIIVCPASLKLNWARETKKWIETKNIQVLSGKSPNKNLSKDIIIINYDILANWVRDLQENNPQILITDECHYYKDPSAKRTKAIKILAKEVPYFIALSGTPIVNRPMEAYNAINIIDREFAPNFWGYAQKYCNARHNGFGWDFNGASNTGELHQRLVSTIMLRRVKADVLKDLPPKLRSIVPMEIDNPNEYELAENNLYEWLVKYKGQEKAKKISSVEALAQIEFLKQVAVKGKMKQAIDWIRDYIEVDGKLVVFATHKFTINQLIEEFKKIAVKLDGSTPMKERQAIIDKFQNDPSIRLFIGNIKAAGVGITLTSASAVSFLELGWTPGEHNQAEDRIHRIGQQADSINIYYLLAQNTIEENICKLLDKKRKVLDSVLDGKESEEKSLLFALLNQL